MRDGPGRFTPRKRANVCTARAPNGSVQKPCCTPFAAALERGAKMRRLEIVAKPWTILCLAKREQISIRFECGADDALKTESFAGETDAALAAPFEFVSI